uniref:Cation efflux protein cytoplasmic domain-containing protein n=1 Tax=Pinguiococcus pyrenoidosus TaxID=172671 RepID=A0A7R9U6V3_9STRA
MLCWRILTTSSLPSPETDQAAVAVTWTGAFANIVLCGAKFAGGVAGNSAGLVADAAHSLTDLAGDAVTLVSYQQARKPPDSDHPFGHGKIESLGTLAVSGLLLTAGIGAGWHSVHEGLPLLESALSLPNGFEQVPREHLPPNGIAAAICLVSLAVKETLYRLTKSIGDKMGSSVLIANAEHHRSDALSSGVALVGVIGAGVGMPLLDPIAGLVVAAMILQVGASLSVRSIHDLLDRRRCLSDEATLAETVMKVGDGLIRDFVLRARRSGPHLVADIIVEVEGLLSASAAHTIGEHIRLELLERHKDIGLRDVALQIKPRYRDHVSSRADLLALPHVVEGEVRTVIRDRIPEVESISAIQIYYNVNRPSKRPLKHQMFENDGIGVDAEDVDKIKKGDADGSGRRVTAKVDGERAPRGISVEVNLNLRPDMTIREAYEVAKRVRKHVLEIRDMQACQVHLELEREESWGKHVSSLVDP